MAICTAIKKNGKRCSFRAKHGEFCGVHAPSAHNHDEGQCIECPICYETIHPHQQRVLACSHTFHKACVGRWLSTCTTCPMCRAPVPRPAPSVARRPAVARRRVVRGYGDDDGIAPQLTFNHDMREVTDAVQRLLAILSV